MNGTYGNHNTPIVVNGWYVYVNSFQVKGKPLIWRWKKSAEPWDDRYSYMGWNDKNIVARKFENKYFINREEALAYACDNARRSRAIANS